MSKVLLVKVIVALQTRAEIRGELVTGVGQGPGETPPKPIRMYEVVPKGS